MELEDKIRFAMNSLKRMTDHTFPFICQILGTNDGNSGELVGTGFRCVLGGKDLIVSASHVIQGGGSRFDRLVVSTGSGERPRVLSDYLDDPVSDLSVSQISDAGVGRGSVDFWPEDRIDHLLERLPTDYLFVHGFPSIRSRSMTLPVDSRVVSQSLPYGVMQRIDLLPDDLAEFQFAMDFEPENGESEVGSPESALFETLTDPRGLSGSPVWRIGVSGKRAIDWSPECCQLVGIVTQWRPVEKLLIATKSTKLLELVDSSSVMTGRYEQQ